MNFLWPHFLWLAVLIPVLLLAYIWLLRRRRGALDMPSLSLIRQAVGRQPAWRRHLPPALILAGLGSLVVAMGRPAAQVTLPSEQQTIMLVMDVSASMMATDVSPDRLSASQEAAKVFVNELPRGIRVGVVAYGGTAHLVQSPTLRREAVLAAIDRFQLQPGTAIGSGMMVALATLFPDSGIDLGRMDRMRPVGLGRGLAPLAPLHDGADGAGAPGSHRSAAIVVLTDGANTAGVPPMDAAQVAASHGVKVFTVGFGTREGVTIVYNGWSMRVRLDEDTLVSVANLTHGQYFHAGGGADLKVVYQALRSRLLLERRETELTALFAMLGAALVLAAAGLSLWWHGRVA